MAFEEGTEQMTCPSCDALHQVRWSRMPVRDLMSVECAACGAVMYRGKTVRDYFEVRPAE